MYKGQRITVIIPCLNEEQGIERVLRAMPEFVDERIVVDNASTDRTSDVARQLGATVIHEEVRGYGRAYKRGFDEATGDLIITLDGDHSYPVDALSYLLEAFLHLNVDFLNASRFPVRDKHAMSFKHKFGNLMLSLALSIIFFPVGARFAVRNVGVPAVDPEIDETGIGRHGLLGGNQDRGFARFPYPLRRDLHSIFVAAGRNQAEPLARRHSEFTVPAEEALLAMSISAIVPVWNGRDLLGRLLDTLDAQTHAGRRTACRG